MEEPETTTLIYQKYSGWSYASYRVIEQFSNSYPSIFLCLVVLYTIILAVWLATRKAFSKIFERNRNNWKKLTEFVIIKHAHLKTRTNFTVVMVLLGPLLIADYFIPTDDSDWYCPIIIILRFTFMVFLYVVMIFVQLYHILLSISLTEDFLGKQEELTELKLEFKQAGKKFWIRKLYKMFLLRDLIIFPCFMLPDITSMDDRGYLLYYEEVFLLATHITIYAMVPFSLLFYFLITRSKLVKEKSKNPLETQILYQAIGITTVQAVLLFLSWIMVKQMWLPKELLPHISQTAVLTLPLIIQVTTILWDRKYGNMRRRRRRPVRPNTSEMFSVSSV
ncbi:unnamed protein product [Caenorhabditis nigoni]